MRYWGRSIFVLAAVLAAAPSAAQIETHVAPSAAPKASGGANLGSAQLMAAVRSTGILHEARSKGTAPCTGSGGTCRVATGVYEVNFTRNLSGCNFTANTTLSDIDSGVHSGTAVAAAFPSASSPSSVRVVTVAIDATSSFADSGFFLQVIC